MDEESGPALSRGAVRRHAAGGSVFGAATALSHSGRNTGPRSLPKMGRFGLQGRYPRTAGANGPGNIDPTTTTTVGIRGMGRIASWTIQDITNAVAWASLGLGVLTVLTIIIVSPIMYSREARRYADLNNRTKSLQNQLDMCYCDSFFFDDIFTILNVVDPSKTFQFSAANISVGANRTYTMPNKNCTIACLDDIPPPVTTFADNEFAVFNVIDITKIITFDASILNTTRVYTWPNKDGTVALLSDIPVLTSVFEDDVFAVQNAANPTKEIMFDVSIISPSTTRTYIWPNKDGTVALLSDIITLLGNSSEFLDSAFAILNDPDLTKIATFNASLITTGTTREYFFPNVDMTLVGQTSGVLEPVSLGMPGLAGGYDTIRLQGATSIDRFFRFRTTGGAPVGRAGVTFSAFDLDSYSIYAANAGAQNFVMAYNATVPTAQGELGDMFLSFDTGTTRLQFHDITDDTKIAAWDVSAITTATTRTYSFQDKNCTLACLDDASGTFLDSAFAIENDPDTSKVAMFNASDITPATTRTYTFFDASGIVALDWGQFSVRVLKGPDQSVLHNTNTPVTWNTTVGANEYDPSGAMTSNTTFTCPRDGIYDIQIGIILSLDSGGSIRRIGITGTITTTLVVIQTPTLTGPAFQASYRAKYNAADTIVVQVFQNSGSTITIFGEPIKTSYFSVQYMGPV
jgi:hypothetical protein